MSFASQMASSSIAPDAREVPLRQGPEEAEDRIGSLGSVVLVRYRLIEDDEVTGAAGPGRWAIAPPENKPVSVLVRHATFDDLGPINYLSIAFHERLAFQRVALMPQVGRKVSLARPRVA